ncbi:MAG: flagellar basal body P-ring protein FlgI [Planctomyces sp.]|nr:flagellar basal body P-ring protein FlgI [Planctomyces sp.]
MAASNPRCRVRRARWASLLAFAALVALTSRADATDVRIKDLTDVEGVRENYLTGLGLVVGLNNTGGQSPTTRQFATNFLQRYGIRLDPEVRRRLRTDTRERTNNVSVVTVTARMPPFRRAGQTIDVMVSAFDDALSLAGGQLILTPLSGVDGVEYAIASGPVSVDSFTATGAAASVQKNHPTSGRIINGATVEQEICTDFAVNGRMRLLLRDPDFLTASKVTKAVNLWSPHCARAVDPGTVELRIPPAYASDATTFLASVGAIRVQPDVKARVVINERTGTIAIGENVRLSRVLITHANLAIFTKEMPEVSQPAPFSEGETVVVPRTEIDAVEEDRPLFEIPETATVADLAEALNALGVPPRDLGVIFQQLRDAGALHAELTFE